MAVNKMQLGEVRKLGIEVLSVDNCVFQIDTADYKVYSYTDKERLKPVDDGYCEIIGNKVTSLFTAREKGTFIIEITYRIKPEILKADIMVNVV